MVALACINDYLELFGTKLGHRVVDQFPPLHQPSDPVWPAIHELKRQPFPAQSLAIMGIVKRWELARCAAAVAECGTGKTLISLGSIFTHARGKRFTALTMVPPQLVEKWARECFLTLPGVRVFFIDGVRNGVSSSGYTGVNEVRLRNGRIVREGLKTTLSELRLAKRHRSARARWNANVGAPSIFIISRERAKLGYFWRHAYGTPTCGVQCGERAHAAIGLQGQTALNFGRHGFRARHGGVPVVPQLTITHRFGQIGSVRRTQGFQSHMRTGQGHGCNKDAAAHVPSGSLR